MFISNGSSLKNAVEAHNSMASRDVDYWYLNRSSLSSGMVFQSKEDGSMVELDCRVPGDGTQWYVINIIQGHRFCED